MHDIKERAAYLRGLVEGSDIARDDKQRMIWEGLVGFCESMADAVRDLESSVDEFGEYIEAIDEDLSSIEKYFYQNEEEEEPEVIFSRDTGDDSSTIEITCPNCHEELIFQDSAEDYEVVCPECGKTVWSHYSHPVEAGEAEHQTNQEMN